MTINALFNVETMGGCLPDDAQRGVTTLLPEFIEGVKYYIMVLPGLNASDHDEDRRYCENAPEPLPHGLFGLCG